MNSGWRVIQSGPVHRILSYPMASDTPSLGVSTSADVETHAELAAEVKVAAWLKGEIAAEIKKIKANKGNAIPMHVSNTSIVRESSTIINRVEMDTKFDFTKIQHILISDPKDCPYKEGYKYINVLLFTDKPVPLIIPYLFAPEKKNKLTEWLFVNAEGARVRQRVSSFQATDES